MNEKVILFALIFITVISPGATGQTIDESCVIETGERLKVFSRSCELTLEEVLNDPFSFGADMKDSLVLNRIQFDSLLNMETREYIRYRFNYRTDGVVRVYLQQGIVTHVMNDLSQIVASPTLSTTLSTALEIVRDSLDIQEFSWEAHQLENGQIIQPIIDTFIIQEIIALGDTFYIDSAQTNYILLDDTVGYWVTGSPLPKADTVLANDGDLEYRIGISVRVPSLSCQVRLSATDGIIKEIVPSHVSASTGTGMTKYNSYQYFQTKWNNSFWGSYYTLFDDSRGDGITTRWYPGTGTAHSEVHDPNNLWYGSGEFDDELIKNPISAHWAVQKSWDYFQYTQQRNGWDGQGHSVSIKGGLNRTPSGETDNTLACQVRYYHDNPVPTNHGEIRVFKGSSSCDPALSLDILGHEFAHGVHRYAIGNPTYYVGAKEGGALMESFADIFGSMIEYYVGNSNNYWKIGDDLVQPSFVRNFMNPNNSLNELGAIGVGQPAWYGQPNYWIEQVGCPASATNDFCGVHINSGVQNHWFYLLTNGGSSPQPNNTNIVTGIGREKAAKITYLNLTYYIFPSSDFSDARVGSIRAAIDEFGACSFEVEQTINAWDAVNVDGGNFLLFDNQMDCNSLSSTHFAALRDFTTTCNFSNESSYKSLTAGRQLRLQPGFRSNQDMHIRIEPCNSGAYERMAAYPSYEGAGGNPIETPAPTEQPTHSETSIILFPNPNNGSFAVTTEQPQRAVITDMLGKVVTEMSKIDEHTMFISGLSRGSYLVRIKLQDGSVKNKKVIVH